MVHFTPLLILFIASKCTGISGISLGKDTEEERECDLLLKRLKRSADTNFIDDDDAFIENIIKSTLNKEKQKCIDKYHLLEMPRRVVQEDDVDEAKELKREVAKLKDLVDVIKDQRYILKTLNNSEKHPSSDAVHSKTNEQDVDDLEKLRGEMRKLQNQMQHSETKFETHKTKVDPLQEKLDKQQGEITNLKHLLQGVLVEMKAARQQATTEAPKPPKDMAEMLSELSKLEKKLVEIQQHKEKTGNAEVVGMRPPVRDSLNPNQTVLGDAQRHVEARSASASERASEDEVDALLSLLTPEKTTSSVDNLLKSLDSDSDDELERRLLTLEKHMKRKKTHQFEEKLKSLEKQLTHSSIQSKTDDGDLGDNAQLKRLLVKMIKKKNQQSESKSLDDDEILDELRSLQKSIKSLSTDDDDLFEDLEEKNGNLDVTIEKLISAGGSGGGTSHRRRKLSQSQIKALRKRIMAMKQGNLGGGDYGGPGGSGGSGGSGYSGYDGDAGDDGEGNGGGHQSPGETGYGHGGGYGTHWHITPIGPSGSYGGGPPDSGMYGPGGGVGYGHAGYGQYGHGPTHGPNMYGPNFAPSDNMYHSSGMYSNIPTNQFGTPLYSGYSNNYAGGYPVYSGYQGGSSYAGHSSGPTDSGSYGPNKYMNGNAGYGAGSPAANTALNTYQSSGGSSYKPFFPSAQEASGSPYHAQPNAGAPGPAQSYQHQPSSSAMGTASVSDLKNQIYDLQGVINTFNKPEYVQKPEDKAMVYNLNNQINELKGLVNTLQETPYAAPAAPSEGTYVAPHQEAYVPAAPGPAPSQNQQYVAPEPEAAPAPQIPPQPLPSTSYAAPAPTQPNAPPPAEYQHPAARNYGNYRRRRDLDVHSTIHRDEVINTLGALLGEILGVSDINNHIDDETFTDNGQREASPQVPNIFDDINAKLAGVRKQLDQQVHQQRRRLQRPLAPLPQLPKPIQQLRSNSYHNYNDAYNNYGGYSNDYTYEKEKDTKIFKLKKDDKKADKKADIFDKILDKILNKVIDKLEKAFPKILEVIFGKFEFTKDYNRNDYGDNYNDYGNNYGAQKYDGGEHSIADIFHGMGMFGLLPMIITKFLSKLHYIIQVLQKNKFLKTFLVPALILLLAAGGIIFLVWWLQPNEDNDYKQISYAGNYPEYRSNDKTAHYYQGPYPAKLSDDPNRVEPMISHPVNQGFHRNANSDVQKLQNNIPPRRNDHKPTAYYQRFPNSPNNY